AVGVLVFDVPFAGSPLVFALGALLFLFVTVGTGVLISTVSETQGQAIQLALLIMLPQILLSGLIFPLDAMAPGVRWIGYLLPLTYFIEVARGVMVKGTPFDALLLPLGMLAVLGAAVFGLSIVRFRRELTPPGPRRRPGPGGPDPDRRQVSQGRAVWGCRGLGVRYGGVVALEDVTLEVPAGAVAAGVGGGGAGRCAPG